MMTECPNHDGAFDCTPFCEICAGEQEYVIGCTCKQIDPLPYTHDDGCPVWENNKDDWETH
jgi:hypothetical protein